MIHSSHFAPKIFPYLNKNCSAAQIDRVQELTATSTLNRTKIQEVGRDGIVCWKKATPSVSVTLRQLEYGSIEFYRKLANVTNSVVKIEMTDFKTPAFDIAGYKTDDNATFLSTIWYPELRVSGFGVSIGDPEANIERSFTLVGEDEITLQGGNKYLVEIVDNSCTGAGHQITIGSGGYADYPDPVLDPDNSGKYFLRVLRLRGTSQTATELVEGTDFTYTSGDQTIMIPGSQNEDGYKIMYSAATYITNGDPFTPNDSSLCGISADSASIYLATGNYLYRLQSCAIDVTLDREDVREIGSKEVVARGARDITCRITLGRILENYTIEEVLRGKAAGYGKIDIREFADDAVLTVKLYSDNTKSTFKLGYEFTDLTPTGVDAGAPLNAYITRGITMEGTEGFISASEGDLSA